MVRFYKIGHAGMCVQPFLLEDDEIVPANEKLYRSKSKATYIMLLGRLKKESDTRRKKKLQIKIDRLLEESPEAAI